MNRAMAACAVVACAVATSVACSGTVAPRAQWKIVVATDAPVPQFGQQIVIELIDDTETAKCTDCRRLIDASRTSAWPISFGIVPGTIAQPRIRVRLYRLSETGADGLPGTPYVIDATARLPPASGVTEVAITLAMSCFGVASDLAGQQTCDPTTGALAPEPTLAPDLPSTLPSAGTWPPGQSVACTGNAPADMVCIPGGAFLLGSSRYIVLSNSLDPVPEHLVQIHPFAIDRDEVTNGAIRQLVLAGHVAAPVARDPLDMYKAHCSWLGANDASNDALPVNCIPWTTARQACSALGKRLPTEAEWEYVASNLSAKSDFPWGADPDICANAVVARDQNPGFQDCLGPHDTPGPIAGGSPNDKTMLGVLNLGGSVAEWVEDVFASYASPCWSTGVVLVDPVCKASSQTFHAVRGGSWQSSLAVEVYLRSQTTNDLASSATGLRCAMSM
jgi:formylglycine-generating enzyme required for sulfatase activity